DHGQLGVLVGFLHEGPGGGGIPVELLLGHPEVHGQGHQPLLGAVVEVALDAAPLRLDDVEELLPAGPQLVDPGGQGGPLRWPGPPPAATTCPRWEDADWEWTGPAGLRPWSARPAPGGGRRRASRRG